MWQQRFLAAKLAGQAPEMPWWGAFHLFAYPPERVLAMRSSGMMPWWVSPELHVVFFRPLAVADYYLDMLLWPTRPWLMHLHGLFVHAALCWVALRLYLRLVGEVAGSAAIAVIAAAIFLFDSDHAIAVAWIAQRNALFSTLFGLGAVLFHVRWRRGGGPRALIASLALLLLALLSGELGVSTVAFVVAHALVLDPAGARRGLLAALPALGLAFAWLLAYGAAGLGAHGSGAYIDPLHEPATFLAALPLRVASLTFTALGLPYDLAGVWPRFSGAIWLVWLAVNGVVVALLLVHACVARHAPLVRFSAIAFFLALVPVTSAAPSTRLVLFASVASALWLAAIIVAAAGSSSPWRRRAAGVLVFIHLVLSPPRLVAELDGQSEWEFGGAVFSTASALPNDEVGHQTLIVVHTPWAGHALSLSLARQYTGLSRPHFTHVLVTGAPPVTLTRPAARTLELEGPAGFFTDATAELYRSTSTPLAVGDVVQTLAFRAEVVAVDRERRPARVRFDFAADLDHRSLRFITWNGSDYVALDLPAIGHGIVLTGGP